MSEGEHAEQGDQVATEEPVEEAEPVDEAALAGEPEPVDEAEPRYEPEPLDEAEPEYEDDYEPEGEGLAALMAGEPSPEPARHWLRWPGFVGALLVVAVVILVPCGAGLLYLTGAFADHGRFASAPDACGKLAAGTVGASFQVAMLVSGRDHSATGSSCDYEMDRSRTTAADGEVAAVLSFDSYTPKGPLSAARMAHAGLNDSVTDATTADPLGPKPTRTVLHGVGEEAVAVDDGGRQVDVFSRVSNLVVHLRVERSFTGETSLSSQAVTLTKQVTGGLG